MTKDTVSQLWVIVVMDGKTMQAGTGERLTELETVQSACRNKEIF